MRRWYGSIPRNRPLLPYDNPAVDIDIGWRGEPYATLPPRTKDFLRRSVYDLINRSFRGTKSSRRLGNRLDGLVTRYPP
jgi:hypothetical protein